MSTPATAGTQTDACSSCAAPLGHDQRYCLHCGALRAGARRPMPAALRPPAPGSHEGVTVAPDDVREGPSIAAVLAGLACLLLAMGVGVLIGRGAGEPASPQAPVTVAAAEATAAVPSAPVSFTSDWPGGKDGWTVALTLLPAATTTPAAVAQAKAAATAKGAAAVGALDSSAYPSLTAGSYVVYSGVFDTRAAATSARAPLAAAFPDARVVRVGETAVATAAGDGSTSTPKPATTTTTSGGSEAGASDTTQEVEKSKKAPKTVGTGGTPPPKDNKPAAGGGDFEDIG